MSTPGPFSPAQEKFVDAYMAERRGKDKPLDRVVTEPSGLSPAEMMSVLTLVVINKPPRMVVHPARGHWTGTLTSALAHHFQQLSSVGGATRPGIVHRLDRDTSGVILVAKTDVAHLALSEQFAERTVEKEYLAICRGDLDRDRDWIDEPIGMHPYQREKMAIRRDHGTSRPARTFYEVAERVRGFVRIRAFPKTGRTHQIRVHLAHLGVPLVGDPLYSGGSRLTRGDLDRRASEPHQLLIDRCALHARRLACLHPISRSPLEFIAPVPDDLEQLWRALQSICPRS